MSADDTEETEDPFDLTPEEAAANAEALAALLAIPDDGAYDPHHNDPDLSP